MARALGRGQRASRASAAPGSTAPGPPDGRLRVKINGEETEGVYAGLDADGALRLLTPDGSRTSDLRRRCVLLEPVRRRNPNMSRKSNGKGADFVFLPLGGVGEIGMNLYLYGYGRDGAREWLIVDMGVTFGSETEPGIDVILPDIRFIEEERHNIVGLLLTHAHEDHFGAVIDLWPLLAGVPVYATPFTAEMLKSKLAEIGLVNGFPLECHAARRAAARSARSTSS